MTPEHDLIHHPKSPIMESEIETERPFVWNEQTKDYKRWKVAEMIVNAKNRIKNAYRDAQLYKTSKDWYLERAEITEKVLDRLEGYYKKLR